MSNSRHLDPQRVFITHHPDGRAKRYAQAWRLISYLELGWKTMRSVEFVKSFDFLFDYVTFVLVIITIYHHIIYTITMPLDSPRKIFNLLMDAEPDQDGDKLLFPKDDDLFNEDLSQYYLSIECRGYTLQEKTDQNAQVLQDPLIEDYVVEQKTMV